MSVGLFALAGIPFQAEGAETITPETLGDALENIAHDGGVQNLNLRKNGECRMIDNGSCLSLIHI